MTADEIRNLISTGLACEYITLEGDGRHWYATIVSPEFEGKRAIAYELVTRDTLEVGQARRRRRGLATRSSGQL